MSLNHLIEGGDPETKINIAVNDIAPLGNLIITCSDNQTFNLKPPSLGTSGQVLKSDGLGGTYFGNDTAGSSGINYQGTQPISVGTHTKINNSLGTEVVESLITEVGADLNLNGLSLQTQGGLINNMSISSGVLESQGTEQLQLASKVNEIKMLDDVDMGNKKIKNLATPTDAADATPKSYVDLLAGGVRFNGTLPTLAGQHLKFDDGTGFTCDKSSIVESGTELNLGSLKLVNMTNPTSNQDGATKSYVDTEISNLPNPVQNLVGSNVNEIAIYSDLNGDRIKQSGVFIGTDVDVNSKKITNISNPVNATDAVNKQYLETELTNKVTGPIASTNEGIAVFDGNSGKLVKNTDVIIFGANNCSGFNILGANQLTTTVGNKIDVLDDIDMINNSMIGNKIIINEIERNSLIPLPIIFNNDVDLNGNDLIANIINVNEIKTSSLIPTPVTFGSDVDLNGNDMIANIINVNEIKTSSLIPTPVIFGSDIDLGGNSILSSNNIFTGRLITPNLESNLSFLPINVLSSLTMNTKDIFDVNGLQVNNLIPPNAPLAQEISVLCPLNLENNKITNLALPTADADGASKLYVDNYYLYSGISDGAVVQTPEASIITTTGVGSLSVPANGFVAGQSFHLTMAGEILNGDKDDFVTVKLIANNGTPVQLCSIIVKLEDDIAPDKQFWELEADFTIRSTTTLLNPLGDILTNFDFTFNKNDTKDFRGNRSVELAQLNTSQALTLDVTAVITGQVNSSIQSRMCRLTRMY